MRHSLFFIYQAGAHVFPGAMHPSEKRTKMKALEKFKLIGISMLFLAGLTACDRPGPAESAGKKLDQAVDEAGKKIDEAGDKAAEKLDK